MQTYNAIVMIGLTEARTAKAVMVDETEVETAVPSAILMTATAENRTAVSRAANLMAHRLAPSVRICRVRSLAPLWLISAGHVRIADSALKVAGRVKTVAITVRRAPNIRRCRSKSAFSLSRRLSER